MIKLQARKLNLRKVPLQEAFPFLQRYHIQGPGTCASDILRIGLYNETELVQLLTFRRYRGITFNWECSRACTKLDITVIGGLSRLMTEATKHLGGEIGFAIFPEIYDGHSMQPAGFEFVKQTKSNTWVSTPENVTKVDYYRWKKPNTNLAIGCIYLLIFDNGKYYVGQHKGAVTVREDKQKLMDNYAGGGSLLESAKAKHKYEMSVIDLFYDSMQGNYREAYWIKYYKSTINGYNILENGQQPAQEGPIAEEYHKKLSEAQQKVAIRPEWLKYRKESMLRYYQEHPELAERQREAMKQKFEDPEYREANRERAKAYWADSEKREAQSKRITESYQEHPEYARKAAECGRAYWEGNQEARERASVKGKELAQDPDKKAKMIAGVNKFWAEHPEAREAQRQRARKQLSTPEARKANSERLKQFYRDHPEKIEEQKRKRAETRARKLAEKKAL